MSKVELKARDPEFSNAAALSSGPLPGSKLDSDCAIRARQDRRDALGRELQGHVARQKHFGSMYFTQASPKAIFGCLPLPYFGQPFAGFFLAKDFFTASRQSP